MSSFPFRSASTESSSPSFPIKLLTLERMKFHETTLLDLFKILTNDVRELESAEKSETMPPPSLVKRILDTLSELNDNYTAADNLRVLPIDDLTEKASVKAVILFIHNTKNKVSSIEDSIMKREWSRALALISSIQYQDQISNPDNQTVGFLVSHFEALSQALTEHEIEIEISVDEETRNVTASIEALVALHSAAENLLMNALKYAGTFGKIRLSMTFRDGAIILSVSDQNPQLIPGSTLIAVNTTDESPLSSAIEPPASDEEKERDAMGSWGIGLRNSFSAIRDCFGNTTTLSQTPSKRGKVLSFTVPCDGKKLLEKSGFSAPRISIPSRSGDLESTAMSPSPSYGKPEEPVSLVPTGGRVASVLFKKPSVEAEAALKKFAVVLVDDDTPNRRLTGRLVGRYPDWAYEPFESAEDFLDELPRLNNEYSGLLIAMDSILPGEMSGLDTLRWLKDQNHPIHEKAIFVWYSSAPAEEDKETRDALATYRCKIVAKEKFDVLTMTTLPELMKEVEKMASAPAVKEPAGEAGEGPSP